MNPQRAKIVWLGFAGLSGLLLVRIALHLFVPDHPELPFHALQDFRDAIYYPMMAWLGGANPYDTAMYRRSFPVGQVFPPYSPLIFLLHAPLALFSPRLAAILYFFLQLALFPVLAWLTIRIARAGEGAFALAAVALLLLASRPGTQMLFLGQPSLLAILLTYAVLARATLPSFVAPVALALSTFKPTFGIPLAAMLLAAGELRLVGVGLAAGAALSLIPLASLVRSAGGTNAFLTSLWTSYTTFQHEPSTHPASTVLRLDVPALVGRLSPELLAPILGAVTTLVLFGLTLLAIRRLATFHGDPGAGSVIRLVICVGLPACIYHVTYDALLLAAPLLEMLTRGEELGFAESPARRRVLVAAMSIPLINYLSTYAVADALGPSGLLWTCVTSLNGVALLVAVATTLLHANRYTRMGDDSAVRKAVSPRGVRDGGDTGTARAAG